MSAAVPTDSLPDAFLTYDHWICWREEERDGQFTKLPVDPHTDSFASTTDAETWSDYETALNHAEANDLGLGFVFTDSDPFVGVDLDKCRDIETGQPETWAKELVQELDSYTEVSPSGTGYHVLLEGSLPEGGNRKGQVEMYEASRFFTVTGDHVEGTPQEIKERQQALEAVHREHVADEFTQEETDTEEEPTETLALDDEELLERAQSAKNGEKFERLWNGSTSGYESHSEADMALTSMLAFWTGGDAAQVDRLFRESGLYREKWDDQHFSDGSTYGERTIEKAIRGTDEFYSPEDTEGRSEDATREDARSNGTATLSSQVDDRLVALEADIERLEARVSDLEAENEGLREALETQRETNEELTERIEALEDEDESESRSRWSFFSRS